MTAPKPEREPDIAAVEQCDRDAAASLESHYLGFYGSLAIKAGRADDHKFVQAFAKHRRAALLAAKPDGDGR